MKTQVLPERKAGQEKMTERIKETVNRTLFELWCGILAYGLIGALLVFGICLIFPGMGTRACLRGFAIGILCALAYAWHLYHSIDRSLLLDQDSAVKKMRLQYILRYVCSLVILVIVSATGIGNVLTTFAGFIGVKIGAYLNKPMKLISDRIYGKEPAESF